jgi:hypothetical protein
MPEALTAFFFLFLSQLSNAHATRGSLPLTHCTSDIDDPANSKGDSA